jgi:hypothetical protein
MSRTAQAATPEPSICQCGCGQPIPPKPHHKYRGAPRFLLGHHSRMAPHRELKAATRTQPPPGFHRSGFCECGCGERTAIAKTTSRGDYAGHPRRYITGHHMRGLTGENSHSWTGGRLRNRRGYWLVRLPGHHLANSNGYVYEHRLMWEQAKGRRLRPDEDVHHVDGDPGNNAPENLIALTKRQHRKVHSDSKETSARRRRGQQRRYEDPAQREGAAERARRRYRSPEERAKTAEATRKGWTKRRATKGG